MKTFFVFMLFSMSALASQGGHGGNGGNGCYDTVMRTYYSAEEMYGVPILGGIQATEPLLLDGNAGLALSPLDFDHPVMANSRSAIVRLKTRYPRLGSTLEQFFELFKRTYVLNGRTITGVFNPSTMEEIVCQPPMVLRPVILMYADGSIAFINNSWKQASSKSQQIFVVHEVLRSLQILHPVGKEMSTRTLLEMCRRILSRRQEYFLLEEYEEKLAQFVPIPVEDGAYEKHLAAGKLHLALESVVMQTIATGGHLGEAINRVRIHDPRFRDLADRKLRKALLR